MYQPGVSIIINGTYKAQNIPKTQSAQTTRKTNKN